MQTAVIPDPSVYVLSAFADFNKLAQASEQISLQIDRQTKLFVSYVAYEWRTLNYRLQSLWGLRNRNEINQWNTPIIDYDYDVVLCSASTNDVVLSLSRIDA